MSLLPSIFVLGAVAVLALGMVRSRPSPRDDASLRRAAHALLLATFLQAAHFFEEAVTGFSARLPALFGLPPMPEAVFVGFNVSWLALWGLSVAGIRSGRRDALFAAWFLAIAGMVNGVGHPLLALVTGGYFPGLFTALPVGLAGVNLAARLRAAFRVRGAAP